MLSKDLSNKEKEEYIVMLRKHSGLIISDFTQMTGVVAIQHHINLKEVCKTGSAKAKKTWRSATKCNMERGRWATKSQIHFCSGRFQVGITGGGDTRKEQQMKGVHRLQTPQCSYQERSFSSSFSRWDLEWSGRSWEIHGLWWLLRLLSNQHSQRWPEEDYIHHTMGLFCL